MKTLATFLLGSLYFWTQALGLPMAASGLLALGLYSSGIAGWMSPVWWLATAPLLYVVWLILLCALSALEMQLLFRRYEKPRHLLSVENAPGGAKHFRLIVCYQRSYLIRCLPLSAAVSQFPVIGRLVFLSYAPSVNIGKDSFFAGFMYDPDLTDIGERAVVGGGCVLSAHSMANKGGNYTYVSARIVLGERSTIGGESRIAMGVNVGADAIVEPFSNVTAMTYIPPGEVWGGNPAVFLRKRGDLATNETESADEAPQNLKDKDLRKSSRDSGAVVDTAAAAKRVVRQALHLPLELAPGEAENEHAAGEWDSLVQLAVAATLADTYECRLPPQQIVQLKSFADVERAIVAKLGAETQMSVVDTSVLPNDPEWLPLLPSAEATRLLSQQAHAEPLTDPLRIVIAASFTAEPVASSLGVWCGAFGIATEVVFAGFNQVPQALLAADSPFRSNERGLNVVMVRPEDFPEDPEAAGMLLDAVRSYVDGGGKFLVVGTMPPPVSLNFSGDRSAVDSLRVYWNEELKSIAGIAVFDFAGVIERIGIGDAGDVAMELAARAPFSAPAYREIGIELARVVRRRRRAPAKVLALDCDNTLWSGVVGEDGFDGIELGADGVGRSFQAFQKAVLRLKQQGVLLVVVSRNEEADVLDVFDRHPDMVLRRSDIVAWRVNWRSKSENLKELATELNLGLDSFVFVDDDAAQRLQVADALPMVHVFPTPQDPAQYAASLKKLWIFDAENRTAEDAGRTEMMQSESARQRLRSSTGDIDGYLKSLEMKVVIREADDRDLPRVAQLTQKTNQFNLSLKRRSLDEIKALGSGYRTFVLSARDRFGDYGQVGACIVRHDAGEFSHFEIDTFLLSCRALGRGVEEAFLHGILEFARSSEATCVRAPFVDGPRNQPARDFFLRIGLFTVEPDRFDWTVAGPFPLPKHVHLEFDQIDPTMSPT
jgi:FkbH-like protein